MEQINLETNSSQDSFLSSYSSSTHNEEQFEYNDEPLTTNDFRKEESGRIETRISLDNESDENIICIELNNNDKIYLSFEMNWTIKSVKLTINV
jgi:hypothetical protein